jgi:hypothetical protein
MFVKMITDLMPDQKTHVSNIRKSVGSNPDAMREVATALIRQTASFRSTHPMDTLAGVRQQTGEPSSLLSFKYQSRNFTPAAAAAAPMAPAAAAGGAVPMATDQPVPISQRASRLYRERDFRVGQVYVQETGTTDANDDLPTQYELKPGDLLHGKRMALDDIEAPWGDGPEDRALAKALRAKRYEYEQQYSGAGPASAGY